MDGSWWAALDHVGFDAMRLLVSVLWQSSILLAAAGLLAFALRRRRAAVRHAVWAAALLAAPVLPALSRLADRTGAPRAEVAVMPSYEAPRAAPPATPPRPRPQPPRPAPREPEAPPPPAAPSPTEAVRSPPPPEPAGDGAAVAPALRPWALAFVAYVVGAAAFLSLVLVGRLRLHLWLRRGRAVTDPRVVAAFAGTRRVRLVESERVHAPIALGLFRARVLLPAGFAAGLSDEELRAVAAHELAHVRRRDALVLELASVVRAVLFFHPLVWVAARQVAALAEEAADDAALEAAGEPVSYAKVLARIAAGLPERALGTELAAGFILSKSAFLRRVEAILSDRRDQLRRLTRWALAGTLVAVLASLALAAALPLGEKPDQAASTKAEGGPLDIRLVGICLDCGTDVLDAEGEKIGEWLGPVSQPWGEDKLRRDLLFALPETKAPILFERFHELRAAGRDRPLGGGMSPYLIETPEGRRYVWCLTVDRTCKTALLDLIERRAPIERVDVTLRYYHGPRREAELTFTGPFTAGTPVEADGGEPGTLLPKEDAGWGNARHARFHLRTTRPLDSNVPLLAYDVGGTRHLADRGSGRWGPSGASFEVTVPGLPLARLAAVTVGEPRHRATFRHIPLVFRDRPARAYPEYLDRKAEALGLAGLTPEDIHQYQVGTPEEALRLIGIARGVDVERVMWALDRQGVDFTALPADKQEEVRRAARAWLRAPFRDARAAAVTLGLKGRWPEFVAPALALVDGGEHNPRNAAARALWRYRKRLAAAEVVQITDLLLRRDDPLTSRRLVQCVAESETPATVEGLWRLARAEESRPWLWVAALCRLDYLKAITPEVELTRPLRVRLAYLKRARPGDEALAAEARALRRTLLTPQAQQIDSDLFSGSLRRLVREGDRAAATTVMIDFLRSVTDFRRADWAIDRIAKQLNLWHGTNFGGLGTNVERETADLHRHDWPAIAAEAVRWHDGRGNGGEAAAPRPEAPRPANGARGAAEPRDKDQAGWGEEADGLRTRLVVDRPVCEWSEMLNLYLDVWNVSDRPIRISVGDWMHREFQIIGPDGEPLPLNWRPSDDNARAYELPPGAMAAVAVPQSANYGGWTPGRYRAVWPGAERSPVADARILPPSNVIEFEMRPPAETRRAKPMLDVPFGEAADGVCWRLTASERSFRAGQPVFVWLEAKNVTAEDKWYDDPWPWGGVKARVVDERGEQVPLIAPRFRRFPPFHITLERLEPGRVRSVEGFDLASSHYLRRPGRYTATCRTQFAFEILPDPAAAADGDPIGRLLSLTEEGWAIGGAAHVRRDSLTASLVRPGSNWERVPGREIELWPEEAGPRWDDSDSIRIWLTEQKAASTRWHSFWEPLHPAEYAGKLPHWHVYLSVPPKALELWPTARDDILLALRTAPEAAPPGGGEAEGAPAPPPPARGPEGAADDEPRPPVPEPAGKSAYSEGIDRQIAMLKVGSVAERIRAAGRLVEIAQLEHREAGTPMDKVEARRAVPALIQACETTGSYGPLNLPQHLARLLAGTSGPETEATVQWLIEMLKTDKNGLRYPGVEALGTFGPAAAPAAEELGRLLEGNREFRHCWRILKTLEAIGPGARPAQGAVRRWLVAMQTQPPEVRGAPQDGGKSAQLRLRAYCALYSQGTIEPGDAAPIARAMAEADGLAVAAIGEPILLRMEHLPAAIAPDVVAAALKPNLGSTLLVTSGWEKLIRRLGPPTVAPLCKALEQGPFARSSAEGLLAALGKDAAPAVPTLVAQLRGGKAGPPRYHYWLGEGKRTARVLAAIGPAAVEPLADLLQDENEHVRALAVLTLGRIGGEAALRHFQSVRDDPSDGVQAAVHAVLLWHDVNRDECVGALCSLVEGGSPRARGLATWLLSGRAVLAPFSRPETIATVPSHPEVRRRMGELLRHQDATVRESAIWVLGAGGGGAPEATIASLAGALSDESAAVRRGAAEALGRQRGAAGTAVPALAQALSDADADVRNAAARALGHIQPAGKAAEKQLVRALADRKTQRSAREALINLELYHASVEALVQDLKTGEYGIARGALFALCRLGEKAEPAIPAIIQQLDSKESDVVEAAAHTLAKLGVKDQAAIPGLTRAVGSSYWSARIEAMRALLPLRATSAAPKVMANLGYDLPSVRRVAAHWLGQLQIAEAVGPLARRLDDEDVGVRVEVAMALGRIGEPAQAAGASLARAAAEGQDPRLRAAALFACVRAGLDPEGARREALRAQLKHPNAVVRQFVAKLLAELGEAPAPE